MHTPNNPHGGSEPMPLQGPITRGRARRNGVELVFAIFRCNFSLAFQRAKERSNPSSYAKVMAVRVNAAQNGIFGPRTQLELTCTRSCDWTLQGDRFRSIMRSVGCMHGSSMVLVVLERFTPARKDSKCTPKWG